MQFSPRKKLKMHKLIAVMCVYRSKATVKLQLFSELVKLDIFINTGRATYLAHLYLTGSIYVKSAAVYRTTYTN